MTATDSFLRRFHPDNFQDLAGAPISLPPPEMQEKGELGSKHSDSDSSTEDMSIGQAALEACLTAMGDGLRHTVEEQSHRMHECTVKLIKSDLTEMEERLLQLLEVQSACMRGFEQKLERLCGAVDSSAVNVTKIMRDQAKETSPKGLEREVGHASESPIAKGGTKSPKLVEKAIGGTVKSTAQSEAPLHTEVVVDNFEGFGEDDIVLELKEDHSLGGVFTQDEEADQIPYSVDSFYWKTGLCQEIARSHWFAHLTLVVVILNAIYIGVEADWNSARNIYTADWPFQVATQFFCVYFFLELVVRFLAFEHKRNSLQDGWFKFDFFMVSTMVIDTWVLSLGLHLAGGDAAAVPTQPLRLLRLFKLTRMARLMKVFPELVYMVKGLCRSFRAIGSTMILQALFLYTGGILLHMLMKDQTAFNETAKNMLHLDFTSITNCMFILLMNGTFMLDNTSPLLTGLFFSGDSTLTLAGAFLLLFMTISSLTILQMLIGVLCDVMASVSEQQRQAHAYGLVKQELATMLKEFDSRGDGTISKQELFSVMCNPTAKAVMKKLDINRAFLLEMQERMFPHDQAPVKIKSVCDMMITAQGDNPATVSSLADGLLSVIAAISKLRHDVGSQLTSLQASMAGTRQPSQPIVGTRQHMVL